MDALVEFFTEAPLGAAILGGVGLVIQAVWTTIFLRRVAERNRAGADAPAELQTAVKDMLPLMPVGFVMFSVALFWWSASQ
jgi:hypothetical protein